METSIHLAQVKNRLVAALFVIDFLLGFAYLIDRALGHPYSKLRTMLHLELEGNLPTWYSSIQLFLVASCFALLAFMNFDHRKRRTYLLWFFPVLFLAMSLDEVAEIHEWVGYRLDAPTRATTAFGYTGVWQFVVGVPFVIVALLLVRSVRKLLPNRTVVVKLCVGIVVFVAGANGIETLANFVTLQSWAHTWQIFFEELFEMVGATIILWAAVDAIALNNVTIRYLPFETSKE